MKFFKKKNWKFFFWKIYRWIVLNYLTLLLARNFFCDHACQKNVSRLCNFSLLAIFLRPRLPKNVSRKAENSIFFFLALAIFFYVRLEILFFAALLALTEINFVFLACSQILLRPCLLTNVSRELENFIFFPNACHFYFLRKLENLIFCSLARKCFWDLACIFFI